MSIPDSTLTAMIERFEKLASGVPLAPEVPDQQTRLRYFSTVNHTLLDWQRRSNELQWVWKDIAEFNGPLHRRGMARLQRLYLQSLVVRRELERLHELAESDARRHIDIRRWPALILARLRIKRV